MTADRIDAHDPHKLVLAVPGEQLPDIRIDRGIDESLAAFAQRFANLLIEIQIPFTFAQAPGRHNEANWSVAVEHSTAHKFTVMRKRLGK